MEWIVWVGFELMSLKHNLLYFRGQSCVITFFTLPVHGKNGKRIKLKQYAAILPFCSFCIYNLNFDLKMFIIGSKKVNSTSKMVYKCLEVICTLPAAKEHKSITLQLSFFTQINYQRKSLHFWRRSNFGKFFILSELYLLKL